ncbi:MAG: helix-turn-helix domain-containing protein [Acidobacteria bacterium]|nr:helix-turn-helix domain-containing protein [Acidobacteriota bacterium]
MTVGARSGPAEPVAVAAASALAEILTPDEVAAYLKVSKKTVYKIVRSGALPAFKAGKHWRVRRADLGAWIARRSKESGRQSR